MMSFTLTSAASRMCRTLLLELHKLIAKGQDDSPEAEAIRDDIDRVYYQLSNQERDELARFSEEIYARGTNAVWLDLDVSMAFPTSRAVNQSLRQFQAQFGGRRTTIRFDKASFSAVGLKHNNLSRSDLTYAENPMFMDETKTKDNQEYEDALSR